VWAREHSLRFRNPELNDVLENHLRPAVRRTGFELRKLDDEPQAGLIDNRLRVEIKQSRFLLADLTDANNGAYWEAGYAEGLGKPVIYLCKRAAFSNEATRPHFDTNHHQTIMWDQATMPADMDSLVATIRFSIPEAKQTD
jgi:nucleoside 2-deoxyribosyltransferase